MQRMANEINEIKPASDIPHGTWPGVLMGSVVRWSADGREFKANVDRGIRGAAMCAVVVNDIAVTVVDRMSE